MNPPYRFAVLSYSSQIEHLLYEFSESSEYSIEYVPISYKKTDMGASELLRKGYDVCLIYTSYAFSVIEHVGNNVVDINKSDMDRVRALLKAKKISCDIGIPIQKKELIDCKLLEQLCGVTLHKITYDTLYDLKTGLLDARARGIHVFIGGGLVASFCKQYNTHCVPILPETASIAEAIDKALSIAKLKREEQTRFEQLLDIFKLLKDGILYVDHRGKITYSNTTALTFFNIFSFHKGSDLPDDDTEKIRRHYETLGVDEVMHTGSPRIDRIISVNGRELVASTMPVFTHQNRTGAAVFLRDVTAVHDIASKVRALQRQQNGFIARSSVHQLKGRSVFMEQLRTRISLYAPHDAPVLIYGETGTGKDLVAQALHNAGNRRNAPFVAINCAALPESLLESELFGYEEGAFTGAKKGGKAGLLEMAHTGTLFLDEIGELNQNIQLRLLRVLENKEIIHIGGSRVIPVNIRIVSATHKSLPELVRNGQFRADLFYRLAVLRLQTPSLRQRPEDIPCLIENLLVQHGRDMSCLTPGILEAMQQYHWPGNIRELKAVVESYLIMLGKAAYNESLFMNLFSGWTKEFLAPAIGISNIECTGDLKSILEETRRRVVMETLTRCDFNKKKAAQQLGISYNTLWRILGSTDETADPSISLANPNSVTMGIVDPAS